MSCVGGYDSCIRKSACDITLLGIFTDTYQNETVYFVPVERVASCPKLFVAPAADACYCFAVRSIALSLMPRGLTDK